MIDLWILLPYELHVLRQSLKLSTRMCYRQEEISVYTENNAENTKQLRSTTTNQLPNRYSPKMRWEEGQLLDRQTTTEACIF